MATCQWMSFWLPLPTVGNQFLTSTERPVETNYYHLINYLILKSLKVALAEPFCRGSRGWGMFLHKNHAAGEANSFMMVEMFVCLCFASQKLSKQEFCSHQNRLSG
jgi:hypothetical protein